MRVYNNNNNNGLYLRGNNNELKCANNNMEYLYTIQQNTRKQKTKHIIIIINRIIYIE